MFKSHFPGVSARDPQPSRPSSRPSRPSSRPHFTLARPASASGSYSRCRSETPSPPPRFSSFGSDTSIDSATRPSSAPNYRRSRPISRTSSSLGGSGTDSTSPNSLFSDDLDTRNTKRYHNSPPPPSTANTSLTGYADFNNFGDDMLQPKYSFNNDRLRRPGISTLEKMRQQLHVRYNNGTTFLPSSDRIRLNNHLKDGIGLASNRSKLSNDNESWLKKESLEPRYSSRNMQTAGNKRQSQVSTSSLSMNEKAEPEPENGKENDKEASHAIEILEEKMVDVQALELDYLAIKQAIEGLEKKVKQQIQQNDHNINDILDKSTDDINDTDNNDKGFIDFIDKNDNPFTSSNFTDPQLLHLKQDNINVSGNKTKINITTNAKNGLWNHIMKTINSPSLSLILLLIIVLIFLVVLQKSRNIRNPLDSSYSY